jgi:hypothetical protein
MSRKSSVERRKTNDRWLEEEYQKKLELTMPQIQVQVRKQRRRRRRSSSSRIDVKVEFLPGFFAMSQLNWEARSSKLRDENSGERMEKSREREAAGSSVVD